MSAVDIVDELAAIGSPLGTTCNTRSATPAERGAAAGRVAVAALNARDEIIRLRAALASCPRPMGRRKVR